jgi:hypothetical protein
MTEAEQRRQCRDNARAWKDYVAAFHAFHDANSAARPRQQVPYVRPEPQLLTASETFGEVVFVAPDVPNFAEWVS